MQYEICRPVVKQAEEQRIIQGLIAGDEESYHYIFRTYYEQMCILANTILHDDFLAQAAVSDIISHIYEIRETLNIRTNLRSYLLVSTRNTCINILGTKVKRTEQTFSALKDDEMGGIFSGTDNVTPQGKLLDNELASLMSEFVNKMPEPTKSSFIMSRYKGMTYRQIATHEGISANTVKFRIKNALKMIEEHFSRYLDAYMIFFIQSLLFVGEKIVI